MKIIILLGNQHPKDINSKYIPAKYFNYYFGTGEYKIEKYIRQLKEEQKVNNTKYLEICKEIDGVLPLTIEGKSMVENLMNEKQLMEQCCNLEADWKYKIIEVEELYD